MLKQDAGETESQLYYLQVKVVQFSTPRYKLWR